MNLPRPPVFGSPCKSNRTKFSEELFGLANRRHEVVSTLMFYGYRQLGDSRHGNPIGLSLKSAHAFGWNRNESSFPFTNIFPLIHEDLFQSQNDFVLCSCLSLIAIRNKFSFRTLCGSRFQAGWDIWSLSTFSGEEAQNCLAIILNFVSSYTLY